MNRSRVFALSIGFFSAECGKYYGSGSQITKRCRQSYCGHKLTNKNYFASNYYRKTKKKQSFNRQSVNFTRNTFCDHELYRYKCSSNIKYALGKRTYVFHWVRDFLLLVNIINVDCMEYRLKQNINHSCNEPAPVGFGIFHGLVRQSNLHYWNHNILCNIYRLRKYWISEPISKSSKLL